MCSAGEGREWLAQLRAICSIRRPKHAAPELVVLVRWYKASSQPSKSTGMLTYGWERRGASPARYDVIWPNAIRRRVVMQPHRDTLDKFVHNHFL